ncbi:hypothetical protein [Marinobacterium aestuariivivens]|uniref:DUF2214 domain-containing protein n=1 Tax=Marinobacterium aestuariivivens TaxID=1698799 RepID=A0ABW1ZTL0_9GAMM
MIGDWLATLEAMGFAVALRHSVWTYPLVNAAHILGVALLLGAILPLDLRLLGLWRTVPLAPLWRVLTRTASAGLALALICGGLLFATRATEYAASSLFTTKMILVFAGCANALALRLLLPGRESPRWPETGVPLLRLRLAAGFSLVAWLATMTLGRLVGYF